MAKKTKTLPSLKKQLQEIFNSYIRKRDEGLPCISCGGYKKNMQSGHYFPVQGYDGLRFDEFNVHGECPGCNCFDESHLIGYGENLPERIGTENYEWLKHEAKTYKKNGYKWSRSELIDLLATYKQKLKDLE